jgi:hypothetical protein
MAKVRGAFAEPESVSFLKESPGTIGLGALFIESDSAEQR